MGNHSKIAEYSVIALGLGDIMMMSVICLEWSDACDQMSYTDRLGQKVQEPRTPQTTD